jgi:photosystem II stability/assembly factor-like uncharacterized protein
MKRKLITTLLLAAVLNPAFSQKNKSKSKTETSSASQYDPVLLQGMKWRNIGPWRGGRSLAVSGVIQNDQVYYFGAVGGGVWKTTDGGETWYCISDSTFKSSSVGAIAVAPSDQNVIYVGMGEAEMRSNISFGDGIYKSTDAGKTWKHTGLEKSYAIQNIIVHPQNPDLVYASCMGKIFGANPERGLYRSTDGGANWQQLLYQDDSTGCVDVKFDPVNPSILYAALWQAHRTPYSLSSGGKGSGLYKSTDGGNTWKNISESPGLPRGLLGRMAVAISPVNPQRVWAIVENENGGLFRSDDGGERWSQINTDKNLRQRPWYFSQIYADPLNENGMIVLNVNGWKSSDGGKTFQTLNVQHGDCHELWWNPNNSNNFIIADDGGGEVTFDGGKTFSEEDFPTAQFYHVSVDNDFPYSVYGCQQDNTSIKIASRNTRFTIDEDDWHPVAGGEAGYLAADPLNPDITYGGEYDGYMSRYDFTTDQTRSISVDPEVWIGSGAESKKYRFNWTFPIMFSPHDPTRLYCTSQFVHRTFDGGQTWETISPDLTRRDPKTIRPSGGPITKDNTGAEVYATIFSFAESYAQKGILWAGSDDGMVHVSKDDGKNWENVSIPASLLPQPALITQIDPSYTEAGTVYLSATRYKSDDVKPYLFKSSDYGKTWALITKGIAANAYCRVIREDPNRQGLLYAGTETGIYFSLDNGENWQSLNMNLPNSPIHDIAVHKRDKDLIVATHGRSFWILDDLSPLHQMKEETKTASSYLLKPRDAVRMQGGSFSSPTLQAAENAPNGVILYYGFKEKPKQEVKMIFFTEKGDTIITYSSKKDKKGEPIKVSKEFYEDKKMKRPGTLPDEAGLNRFVWDLRYPDATQVEGTNVMWAGSVTGPKASPGRYRVRMLLADSLIAEQTFNVLRDPRLQTTQQEYDEQLAYMIKVNQKLSQTHEAINKANKASSQISSYVSAVTDTALANEMKKLTQPVVDSLAAIAGQLYQPKAKAIQDILAHPVMLNDKLAGLGSIVSSSDTKPTAAAYASLADISGRIDVQIAKLQKIMEEQIPQINRMIEEKKIPAIQLKD